MNITLIFAGGTGVRMNSVAKPKQFLELHGKAIIIYTLEIFERHPDIDAIAVVCLEGWEDYLTSLIEKAGIKKVRWIVKGGASGQMSIYNGLSAIYGDASVPRDSIVLIHDGVRPLVTEQLITDNIESVKKYDSAVTVTPAIETVINIDPGNEAVVDVLDRNVCRLAKAPQSFILSDIMTAHKQALHDGRTDFIDSATLMKHYGHSIHTVAGTVENIKITTPLDFYIFRAIMDIKENAQIMGL